METIKRGSTGQLVRHLQDLLKRNGKEVVIDGSFGPATETAVKELQTELDLTPDGIVTDLVWQKFSKTIKADGKICQVPMITEHVIPIKDGKRSGVKLDSTEWITIHNTANPTSTAVGERNYLLNPDNIRVASWHYAVDENHAVMAIPDDEVAWHAANSIGNHTSIGIESCESGDLEKVWSNTVGLAAKLLYEHNLGIDRLTTHNRWSGKDCPRLILPNWVQFAADVNATLNKLKTPEPAYEPDVDPYQDIKDEEKVRIAIEVIMTVIERLLKTLFGRK